MKSIKFNVSNTWSRFQKNLKLVGFIFDRIKDHREKDIILKIFNQVHHFASHHNTKMRAKWMGAEKRLLKRFRKRI